MVDNWSWIIEVFCCLGNHFTLLFVSLQEGFVPRVGRFSKIPPTRSSEVGDVINNTYRGWMSYIVVIREMGRDEADKISSAERCSTQTSKWPILLAKKFNSTGIATICFLYWKLLYKSLDWFWLSVYYFVESVISTFSLFFVELYSNDQLAIAMGILSLFTNTHLLFSTQGNHLHVCGLV
jgi:hypothetical protein